MQLKPKNLTIFLLIRFWIHRSKLNNRCHLRLESTLQIPNFRCHWSKTQMSKVQCFLVIMKVCKNHQVAIKVRLGYLLFLVLLFSFFSSIQLPKRVCWNDTKTLQKLTLQILTLYSIQRGEKKIEKTLWGNRQKRFSLKAIFPVRFSLYFSSNLTGSVAIRTDAVVRTKPKRWKCIGVTLCSFRLCESNKNKALLWGHECKMRWPHMVWERVQDRNPSCVICLSLQL